MALALYRRYRPDTFDGVIGQDQVTVPLMRALDENKLTHAYLFSGPRGCGKTSSARILARCVNCAKGPTSHPCGECASCRDLATGGPGSIDVWKSTPPPITVWTMPVNCVNVPDSPRPAIAIKSSSSTRPTWSRRRASTRS